MTHKNRHSKSAYSLVFAFLVMTVIMIIAGTTIENTTEKVRYFAEMEGMSQARLSAESAAELAVMAISGYEAGYDPGDSDGAFCVDEDGVDASSSGIGSCKSYGSYEVRATAEENLEDGAGEFYVPIPGTGNAGLSDECSVFGSYVVDDPCNWNKLMYGDSVTVPLYASDGTASGVYLPADLGFSSWQLKVRTACKPDGATSGLGDTSCVSGFRYELDGDVSDYDNDDTVVFWQMYGENASDGSTEKLVPDDYVESGWIDYRGPTNTEISESLINTNQFFYSTAFDDYVVLDVNSSAGRYGDLYDLTNKTSVDLNDLYLQLDIVHPLIDADTSGSVPYLEWQFVFESSTADPLADIKSVLVGEGYYSGQSGTFYFPYVVSRSNTGESTSVYTLSN